MSWRVSQHYGFGAASVELAAEPHYVAHRSLRLWPSMRDAGRDFYLSSMPPLLMASFMVIALFVTVSQDKGYTDLEVVMIERDALEVAEQVEPEPVIEPEPPKPVERPVERPVQKLAEKKPEPPRPPPVKRVEKPKPPPPPPVQRVARQKPKPPPVKRVEKAKPKPAPKPKPAFEALAMQPKPAPPPPTRRGNRVRENVAKPKVDLAPLAQAPKLVDQKGANRARRFASVRAAAPKSRPRADLGPPIAARALDAPAPAPPPARARRSAPKSAAERRVAKVSFAAAAPASVGSSKTLPTARRSRTAPKPASSRRRAAPPPLQMAAAAPAAPRVDLPAAARRRADGDRTERNSSSRKRSDHLGGRELAGVPLASLAACVSDREEDALKRKLLAAVTAQRECVSRAGTYRFVETKNLNAFLMTIERSARRAEADRCAELEHALACVSR